METDRQPIPGVDGDDRQSQVHQFFFRKMFPGSGVDFVGDLVDADEGDGFRPGEGGAFAFAVEGRFAPGADAIQALFAFAVGARVLGVHVYAVGAAVDLRSAQFDEFDQVAFKPRVSDIAFEFADDFHAFRRGFGIIEALLHFLRRYPFRCFFAK